MLKRLTTSNKKWVIIGGISLIVVVFILAILTAYFFLGMFKASLDDFDKQYIVKEYQLDDAFVPHIRGNSSQAFDEIKQTIEKHRKEMERMHQNFSVNNFPDTFFDSFNAGQSLLGQLPDRQNFSMNFVNPAKIELDETPDNYILTIKLSDPDFEKKNVNVNVEKHRITIKIKISNKKNNSMIESSSFRTIRLPAPVDPDDVTRDLNQDSIVLTIRKIKQDTIPEDNTEQKPVKIPPYVI
jgi:HSP20 family molecular chaperone IbpA